VRALFGLYRDENYTQFYWGVTWIISFVCNQKCSYCFNVLNPEADRTEPNYEKALGELLRVKPKHICISGGEPTLVPNIVDLMRRLREGIGEGMQLEFNSNCTGRPELLYEILPYANILAASLDGLGEVNKAQRGVDGDQVLETVSRLALHRFPSWSGFRKIMFVPTATVSSYPRLPEMFDALRELRKKSLVDISVEVKPMFNYTDPRSPASTPGAWKDFTERSREWEKEYKDIRVEVRGVRDFSPLAAEGVKEKARCWRQFFNAKIWPDAHWTFCKPDEFSLTYFFPRYAHAGIREKIILAAQSIYSLFLNPHDLTCYMPCEHCENLDRAILAGRASELARKAKEELGLTLTSEDLRKACTFIKEKCNPDFVLDMDFSR